MSLVAIAACGIAALANASPAWASAWITGVISLLFFSICRALSCRGPAAAFWTAFALCGWGYLVLVFTPIVTPSIVDSLATTRLLRSAHALMGLRGVLNVGAAVSVEWNQHWYPATVLETRGGHYKIHYDGDSASTWDEWVGPPRIRAGQLPWEPFQQIGQALWAAIVGYIGGVVARTSVERGRRNPDSAENAGPQPFADGAHVENETRS
jgi:hypothetical protein